MKTILKEEKLLSLKKISNLIRKRILITSHSAKIPHLGSCLSCVDILVYLYWEQLKINPKYPYDDNRDRFLLSKGHGAPALFQVLAERGFFSKEKLKDFGKEGSVFHEHPPVPGYIPGVEAATGSLGHGFPMALGMALGGKIKGLKYTCYALLSDGECNEGSIWEAAMLSSAQKLSNLIGIVDYNKWQATGRSKNIMSLDPLSLKWKSFGAEVIEINGHDFNDMKKAFDHCILQKDRPSMIIAHTIKGKGITFMEDDNNWHYRTPNSEELELALKELDNEKEFSEKD